MTFFRVLRHLLPRARAWRLTVDNQLREFFEGLGAASGDPRAFFDLVWLDIFPASTRALPEWEQQFGLRDVGLTEQERRDRLDGEWKATGGQSPGYIQDVLRGAGFDVYVHDWWQPGTEPAVGVGAAATPRNPLLYLERGAPGFKSLVECGMPQAQCGEDFAQAGNVLVPVGYPLVNKVVQTEADILVLCGERGIECGAANAVSGGYDGFVNRTKTYIVPTSKDSWAHFVYIGGETFGDQATISEPRRDEFENLCLKICPSQLWIGVIVKYT